MVSASSLRARLRSEMHQEIKDAARRRLAEEGANLSLRAVARDMDIVASALYRYFPSRDALLTALIIDAYEGLGAAAEAAEAAVPRDDPRGRWLAVCRAVRAWALAHPAEYGLLYGSPVPGYAAPPETVAPASKVILLLAAVVGDAPGEMGAPRPLPEAVRADLRRLIDEQPGDLPEERLDRVLLAWTHLFGQVGFEVFHRLDDMISARADYFEHHMALLAELAGLP
ncbi:TetR family transcriptional regulator [Amycolatopsis mediterranei S699]|uniref:TetR family transcriptional regulator n=2 Tax=Amycolatopsis mediterranei TaxID=33910 RepID=A0A0H3D349_AMYMU|nr:TetR family transcriptional regulator [Amycolatopsis mediterranei U32]AEK41821.1 TetR family transcriptional regulator [Amycolatopsis mediterranei S699]AFO76776.1 TetR family transcriptional regulator [Amycolatopsis mediterranei S699]AGT83904.1 TetR family transcriptional regulator [Amycolatopsis mediterranei RB]